MNTEDGVAPTFADEARKAFHFLKECGYSCSNLTSSQVRFESKKIYITVSHEMADGEVSITFGRKAQDEEFSFTLFLRLVNPILERNLGERLAYTFNEICYCLEILSKALRTEGFAIVEGDDSVFDRMRSVRWWDFKPDAVIKEE